MADVSKGGSHLTKSNIALLARLREDTGLGAVEVPQTRGNIMSLVRDLETAWRTHKADAARAFDLFDSYCGPNTRRRRVPGMGTTERLALRIYYGKTVEQAAASEYVYRWSLAIKAPDQCIGAATRNPCTTVFGAPHTIGM